MATYRFEAKIIGRSQGYVATASAAYRSGEEIEDVRTHQTFDYTRKRGVLHAEIIAPANTPDWMHDRAQLWNAVERIEKRKDSQLARDLLLSLPHELTYEQRLGLVRDFVKSEFVAEGMIADIAIHAPDRRGDPRNHHAHIMLTMRELIGGGFGQKIRRWNATDQLEKWREHWADAVNRHLERHGHEARVDHRSLADQGLDREPEPKQGPVATEMERNGQPSHAGDDRRAAKARNDERAVILAELAAITAEIIDLQERRARQGRQAEMSENPTIEDAAERQRAEAQREEETRRQQAAQEATQRDETRTADNVASENDRQRETVAEPTDAETEGQQRHEALRLRDLAEQDKRIQAFKLQREIEAEEARRNEDDRRQADERRAAEGDLASAEDRYAQALGENYDIRDPYVSLARAAMAEYAAFRRQQEDLRKEIAAADDPDEREALSLRMRIEGCDYMAITSERLAGISATIAGREDAPQAERDREHAEAYQELADGLRDKRAELLERINRDRDSTIEASLDAEPGLGREAGRTSDRPAEPGREKRERDSEVRDARSGRTEREESGTEGSARPTEWRSRSGGRGEM